LNECTAAWFAGWGKRTGGGTIWSKTYRADFNESRGGPILLTLAVCRS